MEMRELIAEKQFIDTVKNTEDIHVHMYTFGVRQARLMILDFLVWFTVKWS